MRNKPVERSGTVQQARQRGLTLVELLVAISVLGFVAVLGWRGLDSIVRARIALTGEMEQTRGMQLAFAQLQSDCAHLASASALPNRMPLTVAQGRLTLVRTVFADNQPSRLQVITYRLKDGVLTRRESAATRDLRELDALWLAAASDPAANDPAANDTDTAHAPLDRLRTGVALQSGVTAMAMRLWVGGGWRAGADTQPPATGQTASIPAPAGLEVTLQLRGRDTRLLKIFLLGAA